MSTIQPGDMVRIHFTGRLADGTIFGTTAGGEPVHFTAGEARLPQAIHQLLLNMHVGDKQTITLSPEQGFGQRDSALEQRVPRNAVPEGTQVGTSLTAWAGRQSMTVWVRELGDEYALLDGNHPLAGRTVCFEIELVSVEPSDGVALAAPGE